MDKKNKNIVSIEDRIPKLKEARKKKANRRLVFYLSLFFFLILIIVYLQSPLSQVKTIAVNSNTYISDEEVIETIGISTDTNIWSVDTSELEEKLEAHPVIREADITRDLPRTIAIDLNEKKIIGFLEENQTYYPVLENGEILQDAASNEFTGQAPSMVGFTDDEYLGNIANELSNLPDDILSLISEIHRPAENDNQNAVIFYMNDGFIVQASVRDFAEGMSAYPSVVAQLDPDANGIIHVGVGIYFEDFSQDELDAEDENENEEEITDEEPVTEEE